MENLYWCPNCKMYISNKSKTRHLKSLKHLKKVSYDQNYDQCECGRMKDKNYPKCYRCNQLTNLSKGECLL